MQDATKIPVKVLIEYLQRYEDTTYEISIGELTDIMYVQAELVNKG